MAARSTAAAAGAAPRSVFWSLFRLTLNNTFGLSAARYRYLVKKERVWEPILILVSILTAGGFFVFALYQTARAFVASGAQVGQPEVAFVFAVLVAAGLVFFFGLMAVISVFYFSTDLEVLVPLPLRPGTIVLAKFGSILVGEYIGVLVVLGPTAVAYAQAAGGELLYWLSVIVVALLVPVVPLALASALSLVVMRLINRRHRDFLIVVFSLALLALMLGFQMSILSNAPSEGDPAVYLQQLLSGQISLVNMVGRGFPPAIWATKAVTATGLDRLGSLAGFAGVSLLAVWVMWVVGARVFYGGLIGGEELACRRLTASQAAAARAAAQARTVQGGVLRALFLREWRLFMRVPLYVMNGFIASLIVPVLFLFPATSKDPEIQALFRAMSSTGNSAFFIALGLGALIVLLVTLNTTAASAISREGKYFWISKVIPVTPEQQVQGKMLFAAVGALVSAAPAALIFAVAMKMSPFHVAAAVVLGLLASVVILLLSLLVDMARPFLKWTNPQQAVKSNLNVIIPLPMAAALLAGMGFLAVWLHRDLGLAEAATVGIMGAILAVLVLPAYRVTVSAAKRLYERLEP